MRRLATLTTAMLVASSMLIGTAAAGQPVKTTFDFADTVQGETTCGELRWDITGTVERKVFLDKDGNVVRILDKVREDNTITNLDTNESLQEGPDSFIQHIFFNNDGTVTLEINGLSALVNRGENQVVDAGRVVLFFGPGGVTVLGVSGRHDIRGIDPTQVDNPILLEGFCPAFA